MANRTGLESARDADLLRDARRSSFAFAVLYERHAERINAFFVRRTRDAGIAIELTAETFAEAWFSRDRYVDLGEGTIAPWLFGIARHVLASSVRKRVLEQTARNQLHLVLAGAKAEVADAWLDGLDDDLSAALAGLPDGQRRAVELRFIADQAYEEVARRLDITPAAARVRVHRGIATIRRRLGVSAQT